MSVQAEPLPAQPPAPSGEPLVKLEGIKKYFPITQGILFQHHVGNVHAVDDVDLEVHPGQTVGLVGETGCGKSTLARVVMRLYDATEGKVWFNGQDITHLKGKELQELREDMQMVFQDPYASLNPRKTVGFDRGRAVPPAPDRAEEPDQVRGAAADGARGPESRALQPLSPRVLGRPAPADRRGARSLALRPKLIVCDEPVSALDVSIQAQILNLLGDLQDEFKLTYLFIAHDLSVVKHVSDRVAVMYLGKIVEMAEGSNLYRTPKHPYSGALLSAVPMADPKLARQKRRIILQGDVPSPIDPPSGCRFHPRCPQSRAIAKAEGIDGPHPRCVQEVPELTDQGPGQIAACHFPLEGSIIEGGGAAERFEDAVVEAQEESLGEDSAPN